MNLSAIVGLLARGLAVAGGLVLVVLTTLTVVSITGRAFIWAGLSPVRGDFELVEAGVGFAVFSFLPWCQFTRGHATVDIFTNFLPPAANRIIDLVTEILMTVFITVVAWRLWYGMLDKMRYNETTFILQFPVWWPYAACMVAAAIGVMVSFYLLYVRVREVATGEQALPSGQGGLH
ncbi:MAG: TRAP transporter small permease [Rhizobiaceae bacterium]